MALCSVVYLTSTQFFIIIYIFMNILILSILAVCQQALEMSSCVALYIVVCVLLVSICVFYLLLLCKMSRGVSYRLAFPAMFGTIAYYLAALL